MSRKAGTPNKKKVEEMEQLLSNTSNSMKPKYIICQGNSVDDLALLVSSMIPYYKCAGGIAILNEPTQPTRFYQAMEKEA